jgi:hypothetical protein
LGDDGFADIEIKRNTGGNKGKIPIGHTLLHNRLFPCFESLVCLEQQRIYCYLNCRNTHREVMTCHVSVSL